MTSREDAYTGNPYEDDENYGYESWPYWLNEPEYWEHWEDDEDE